MGLPRVFTLLVPAVSGASSFFPVSLRKEIEERLHNDCGQDCLNVFHDMDAAARKEGATDLQSTLLKMGQKEVERINSFYQSSADFQNSMHSSFDKASCAAATGMANKCNYARVAAMGAYQAINTAAHVLGVVGNV